MYLLNLGLRMLHFEESILFTILAYIVHMLEDIP